MAKRGAIDSFFQSSTKKSRTEESSFTNSTTLDSESNEPPSQHPNYPFPVPQLPPEIFSSLKYCPAASARIIKNQPDLDLSYYQPFIPKAVHRQLFCYLRNELFFYRVKYKIKRGSVETDINTPRYTSVFGVDDTSKFLENWKLVDAGTNQPVSSRYSRKPRPIPQSLDVLRLVTENVTGECFNFCLVNFYAGGSDSISYHSDDERFLGTNPAIASFSLGAKRDFLMKHKPASQQSGEKKESKDVPSLKIPLASGDCVLMRGPTQAHWLHSIPKRKGDESGRINITFRRALVKGGTENYYQYNVGDGPVYKWDESTQEMKIWSPEG